MSKIWLSKNFTLQELCVTHTGLKNTPHDEQWENLSTLANTILQPLRNAWGKPIYINSGFRSPAVNKRVGGVANSAHLQGLAADISGGSREANKQLFALVRKLALPFDQLIDEHDYQWIHISIASSPAIGRRAQVLHM